MIRDTMWKTTFCRPPLRRYGACPVLIQSTSLLTSSRAVGLGGTAL